VEVVEPESAVVDEGGLADTLAEVCRTKLNGTAKSDGPVLRGRYDQRAVRREGDGADGISMALERLCGGTCRCVLEPDGPVVRG
jgi:hypothetical protein